VDYPIFNPENNLHITLSKFTSELHGLDLNVEGLKTLNLTEQKTTPFRASPKTLASGP
jgi:hypothetical protein